MALKYAFSFFIIVLVRPSCYLLYIMRSYDARSYMLIVGLMGPDLELMGRSFSLLMMKFMIALMLWDCRRTF